MACLDGRFPPASRLSTPADFKSVFASSRRFSDSQFIILARPNGRQHPRLGFAIARSKIRQAVRRNRVKRIVREYFRTHGKSLGGLDLVVMAQASVKVSDPGNLRRSLERHWMKLSKCAES